MVKNELIGYGLSLATATWFKFTWTVFNKNSRDLNYWITTLIYRNVIFMLFFKKDTLYVFCNKRCLSTLKKNFLKLQFWCFDFLSSKKCKDYYCTFLGVHLQKSCSIVIHQFQVMNRYVISSNLFCQLILQGGGYSIII